MNTVFVFLAVFSIVESKIKYENYHVIRTTPQSVHDLSEIWKFGDGRPYINYWMEPTIPGTHVDIMVPPENKMELESFLRSKGMEYKMFISNVQELMDKQDLGQMGRSGNFGWNHYHTLGEINQWLQDLAYNYTEVELVTFGETYEKRNLTGVHVSFSSNNSNKAVFIESNMHARECIGNQTYLLDIRSELENIFIENIKVNIEETKKFLLYQRQVNNRIGGAVSTYILNEILTSTDPEIRRVAESHDWYFLPVANPDGYVYSFETDRMWRKTRTPHGICTGVDPNRNWDNHWREAGADTFPCSESYAGSRPFSEPCTKTLSEYLSKIGHNLVAYFSFHAYAQYLMVPYGWTSEILDNYNVTYPIGLKAAESLAKRYGTQYKVGSIYNVVYPVSGSTIDWVKTNFKTPLVYVYELRDTGTYGFLLPPKYIVPTALETLDSLLTIFEEYQKLE